VTGVIFALSLVWTLCVTGPAYLIAFGIYGAGELVGVYAPNYILSASSPRHMRRNMAFVTMMMAPAAPAGYLFGAIANSAALGRETGLRLSFVVCLAILVAGVGLALWLLPKSPQPESDHGAS
jgi:MFS family permease